MNILGLLSRTKLYWGLLLICLIGALASPHSSSGNNIFLSYGNLTDVLRQVSITGLVATGMTMVILLGGIDLSVGSVMGFSTIICAMLLTKSGWTAASIMGVPAAVAVSFMAVAFLARFVFSGLASGHDETAGLRREIALGRWRGIWIPSLLGLAAAVAVAWFTTNQVPTKFGVLGVLLVAPCVALVLRQVKADVPTCQRYEQREAGLELVLPFLDEPEPCVPFDRACRVLDVEHGHDLLVHSQTLNITST